MQSLEQSAFSDEDVTALQTMADQLANAIANSRLYEQAQSRAQELIVLNELGQALTASLNVQEVIEETYRQAARLVDTSNFFIGLYHPEQHEIEFVINITDSEIDKEIKIIPAERGLSGYVVSNRTSLLIPESVGAWLNEHGIKVVGDINTKSWLGVPLLSGDQVLGVMAVHSYTTPGLYTEHDRELLMAIANQAVVAIQNARFFEDVRQSQQEAEERLQETIALQQLSQALSGTLQVAEILDIFFPRLYGGHWL